MVTIFDNARYPPPFTDIAAANREIHRLRVQLYQQNTLWAERFAALARNQRPAPEGRAARTARIEAEVERVRAQLKKRIPLP